MLLAFRSVVERTVSGRSDGLVPEHEDDSTTDMQNVQ